MTLVEYGSYACRNCHAVHDVVEGLRSRFGDRMRYAFRHLPVPGSGDATRAAELAEYAAETTGRFWEVHEALMERGRRSRTATSDGSRGSSTCRPPTPPRTSPRPRRRGRGSARTPRARGGAASA